jgi:hypothetical protein
MATVETQILDDIIVKSRRKLMTLGASALAGLVVGGSTIKQAEAASYTDADILNFALNLEYLEANFYYIAAFGCTIDKPNATAITAGAPSAGIPITLTGGVGTAGGTVSMTGANQVNFSSNPVVGSYAVETAIEEGKHVLFLQAALSTAAVNQPVINLTTAWQGLGKALTPSAPTFTPYDSPNDFLLGAYVFEDVGVTAYHGAASLLTVSGNLSAAAGILGVEAYHAGLVRTTINNIDPNGTGIGAVAQAISTLRASLAKSALLGVAPNTYDANPDDVGPAPYTISTPTTGNSSLIGLSASKIVDADLTNSIAFSRNTLQVLNIVTGGGAVNTTTNAAISPATGVFFTNGMNKGPNGFA